MGFFYFHATGVYFGYMKYESEPDIPASAGGPIIEESVKEKEKKPLFGLSEEELAELDKKDEKYWNN